MKVSFFGFEVALPDGMSLDDLCHFLKQGADQEVLYRGAKRIFYLDEYSTKYWAGLVVTIRDYKKFCRAKRDSRGRVRIEVDDIEQDSSPIDFNLFVINRETLRGIYLTYWKSFSLQGFLAFFRKSCGTYKRKVNELSPGTVVGWPQASALLRDEDLKTLIKELEKVKRIQFSFASVGPDTSWTKPLSKIARSTTTTLTFDQGSMLKTNIDLGSAIASMVKKLAPKKARVFGEDLDGYSRTIDLIDNYTSFGTRDYDEVAAHMRFSASDFGSTQLVKDLVKISKNHSEIFEA